MKIFIADHSEVFRLGLTSLLKNQYSEAHISGGESIKMLPNPPDWTNTDMVILQQSDYKQKGTDFHSSLNALKNGPKILILSDQNDFAHARYLFSLGINGYADRAASIAVISEAVHWLVSGKSYVETSLLIQYFNHLTAPKRPAKVGSGIPLTSKELEIATYLLQGLKTNEISRLLQKKATTISSQKYKIYQKLGISNVIELMHFMEGSLQNQHAIIQNKC